MTKDEFISSHRLSLLSRAKSINNISRACRDYGVSRTYYYKWAKRYVAYGTQGLAERPRPKPVMPNSTRADIVDKILAFIKHYPTYGPTRIANQLGGIVCSATVYNILRRHGLCFFQSKSTPHFNRKVLHIMKKNNTYNPPFN